MKFKPLQIFGFILLSTCLMLLLVRSPLNLEDRELVIYVVTQRIIGFLGLILLVPWGNLNQIIFDTGDYMKSENNSGLITKLRFRALLLKNISVILLFASLVFITACLFIVYNTDKDLFLRNDPEIMVWNSISVRVTIVLLVIFLIHVLFNVFRYLLRLAAYYDGLADALELHILNEQVDLVKVLELFTPEQYDIRELKDSSLSSSLLKLIKQK